MIYLCVLCRYRYRYCYLLVENVPPLGVKGFNFVEEPEYEPVKVSTDNNNNIVMENIYIRATFDKSGHLIGLTDKKLEYVKFIPDLFQTIYIAPCFNILFLSLFSRPLIRPDERGNVFKMYEDIVSEKGIFEWGRDGRTWYISC